MEACDQQQEMDLLAKAREFGETQLKPIAKELDKEGRFPVELISSMAEAGFFGMNYPVKYGGLGYSSEVCYRVMQEIAKASAGVALTLHVHWMAIDVLLKFGTPEQQERYLPDMVTGKKIGAFTISEAQAGSDAAAIMAEAAADGETWILNGAKFFCTNGGLADLYIVAFKTDPAAGAKGISLFLIEKGQPGFQIGENLGKMGCRSSVITSLTFEACCVPKGNLIGKLHEGFKAAMYGLVGGRLGMASMGLGIAEAALEAAAKYANKRQAFGKPLSALYSVQAMLAEMYIRLEAANLLVADTARKRDSGKDYSVASSVAKLFAAETATDVCTKALQVFGGHGYMKYNDPERFVRDARLLDIGVGASEVLKMVVGMSVAKTIGGSS